MVVQTRFFSCRFSISHAKQRPTTAPRRAARVRATAFPARPWSDAWFAETQNASAAAAQGPYRIDIVDRKPGFRRNRLEFFPNGDRLKGQQNCQSCFL